MSNEVQKFYNHAYSTKGVSAQRRYPNEELCRFIGSRYLDKCTREQRAATKVLEVGCGPGGNLWMLVQEGFDVYGLDISPQAVALCQERIKGLGHAHVQQSDMLHTPYDDGMFDAVCDVLSANCFPHNDYLTFIAEVARILKPGGLFFFYTPCTESEAFSNYAPASKLDAYTLDGIKRETSPFFGNMSPFHFLDECALDDAMPKVGLKKISLERNTRTYRTMQECFVFLVGVYQKID